ncbi:mannose-P-dolichol utilization defect 1 protein, partial [Striga asiatica]
MIGINFNITEILCSLQNKSTGELSFITSFMNFGGSMGNESFHKPPGKGTNERLFVGLISGLMLFSGRLAAKTPNELLVWEECYYETVSCSWLSGDLNPENSFHDYSPSWVSSETCNLQSSVRAGDKVHLHANKMMIDNQVHVVGEGIWEEQKYIATITIRKWREDEEVYFLPAAGCSCYYANFLGVKEQVL